MDDFFGQNRDASAEFTIKSGGWWTKVSEETITVESPQPGAGLMFEDFAAQIRDASLRHKWMHASERTQELLDAVWQDALRNEA